MRNNVLISKMCEKIVDRGVSCATLFEELKELDPEFLANLQEEIHSRLKKLSKKLEKSRVERCQAEGEKKMQYFGVTSLSRRSSEDLFRRLLFCNALKSIVEEVEEDRERVEVELLKRYKGDNIDYDAEATEQAMQLYKSEIADYLLFVEKKIKPKNLLISGGEQ